MVGLSTIIAVCVTLFISLFLPIIVLIVFGIKNRKAGIWTAWMFGALGFFVMQVVLRLPILTLLSKSEGFLSLANNHFVIYCLILAFTAGLFEVVGRYAVAKILYRKLTFKRGLAAGLGHGGIEAMIVAGLSYINNLVYISLINSGQFDTVVEQTKALGVDTASLLSIKEQLTGLGSGIFYLAGYERALTMILQAALSLLVCYFVSQKKDIVGILICLLIHTFVDFTAPFINGLSTEIMGNKISQQTAYVIIYIMLTILAAAMILLMRKIYLKWKVEKTNENNGQEVC